jgi:serine phosphatase RsbU (regulator of sigma subunit)
MAKSVNENIEISKEIHNDIKERNLLTLKLNRELEENEHELELLNESLEEKVETRTKEAIDAKKEVEAIHKHTRDSIEYASLIQGALIPEKGTMEPFFKDHFVTWTPKDTVGGDIWLFEQLRHEDECLLMFIDCTGHGVPGAFVTMIVKSIEREIVSKLKKHPEFDISPAIIMGYFNRTMKKLLRQESKDSLSNAGWDGGIIYYNKRTQILKFAGAETPLFYMTNDGEFKTIKGNRYSVGYKKCDSNYEYKETIIEVEEGMKFFCTTDGYLDQNGGSKDFPFGKKRFGNIIKENYTISMEKQKTIFIEEMNKY